MAQWVYIAVSLDGFIARKDGSIDYLANYADPDGSDYGFQDFMDRMDAVVMGRKTFETVLGFPEWPYPKPVFVLSSTLKAVPESLTGKARLIKGNPTDIVNHLNAKGFQQLYIDGGQTIQRFLELGLIDELILSNIPLVLGDGIPLFSATNKNWPFTLKESVSYRSGIVKSHYQLQKETLSGVK